MSAADPMLDVILVEDVENPSALCRRPAVDWLLDSVTALSPTSVALFGGGSLRHVTRDGGDRDGGGARDGGAARIRSASAVTLVLPCSMPLVRTATLRRIVASARLLARSAGTAAGADAPGVAAAGAAVAIEFARRVSWWAEGAGVGGPVGFALAGSVPADGQATVDDLAAWCVAGAPLARRRLAQVAARVHRIRLRGVEALWLNDSQDRAEAQNALYAFTAANWLASGVVIDDPASTRIDATVRIGSGVRIRPNTELIGDTVIGPGSTIGPTTTVRDCQVGQECLIQYAVCQDSEIGDGSNIGPFTWLRSGTTLGARCRAGAFVELADSVVGDGTAIPHLGGLFSADVGRDCNIAGMSAPANFNNGRKQRVHIGDDVLIGAGNILVAPVSIGDGAITAAGSIITDDVPSGALGMARSPQRNIGGWATRERAGQPPADDHPAASG